MHRFYCKIKKYFNLQVIHQPRKEHFYCQLCERKFEIYLTHINSNEHQAKIASYAPSYDKIKNTLIRINSRYNDKAEKKKEVKVQIKKEENFKKPPENLLHDESPKIKIIKIPCCQLYEENMNKTPLIYNQSTEKGNSTISMNEINSFSTNALTWKKGGGDKRKFTQKKSNIVFGKGKRTIDPILMRRVCKGLKKIEKKNKIIN